jgi:hypothetical protein
MTALESEWGRLTAKNRKYDADIVLRDLNDTCRYHKFSCMMAQPISWEISARCLRGTRMVDALSLAGLPWISLASA